MPYTSGYIQKARANSKTDAKGLEKTIIKSAQAVQSMSYKVSTIFYGKDDSISAKNSNKRMKNPLDIGILPLLDILTSVDACELVAYSLDKLRSASAGAVKFNPKSDPPSDTFGKIKWSFQKVAFDAQTQIDGFYNDVGDINSLDISKGAKALNVITEVKNTFATFTQIFSNGVNPDRLASANPDIVALLEAFPQLRSVGNYINDSLSFFDKFSDFRQLRNEDIQKAVTTIGKIRQYCVLIQSLNNPVGAIVTIAQNAISSELDRLLKDIDVQKLVPTLKNISQELKKLLSMMNSLKSIVDLCRLLIRVFLNLMFAFRVIIQFFRSNPTPNKYTTVGVTNRFSDSLNNIKNAGPNTFEVRLSQINTLLNTVSLFLNTTLPLINEVIQKVNTLIASIQRCENSSNLLPESILEDLNNTSQQLNSTASELQYFLDQTTQNNLTRSGNTQLGQFTIEIITEQITEPTFGLRRRYGVAFNNNGVLQVQSQPTFASDDNVIINEVKLLLQQNGLIQSDSSIYTDSEINVMNESRSYLADDNLDIYPQIDLESNTGGTDILTTINNFVTNLPGGTTFLEDSRRAVRERRSRLSEQLRRR